MTTQGQPAPGSEMRIRVFYPNPLIATSQPTAPIDLISKEYVVSYIIAFDPIYHEVIFVDDQNIRRRFLGLACEITEKMPDACGIDAHI